MDKGGKRKKTKKLREEEGDLGAGKDEGEVVVEIGELAVVVELLTDTGLIGGGGDVLLQEGADLSKALFLGLPHTR